jgi:hypothetical protein
VRATQDLSEPVKPNIPQIGDGIPQIGDGKSEAHHKTNLIVGGTLAHN